MQLLTKTEILPLRGDAVVNIKGQGLAQNNKKLLLKTY